MISGIDEHPVRVILHDRYSGERLKLTIERSGEFKPIEKVVVEKVQPVITKVVLPVSKTPTAPPPAPKVPSLRAPSLTPAAPKIAAPAPKAVPPAPVLKAEEDYSLMQPVERVALKLTVPKLIAPKLK